MRWIPDVLETVGVETRELVTQVGPAIRYDGLLLALGARPLDAVPGAMPFAGPRDVSAVREAIEAMQPGRRHRIAFAVPAGVAWTLPLYELALMTSERGRRLGLDLELEVVTPEPAPLDVFSAVAARAVRERLELAGIRVRTASVARTYAEGRLWLDVGHPLDVDLAIALPRLRGPGLPGLPADADGFVPVDAHARVRGVDGVWAVGDMTTWPLKQGGLAAQQADVAAADIAARIAGADVPVEPYRPRLQGKLLTGADPLYLERRPGAPPASEASAGFLWWPAHKVAGRHLGRFLDSLGSPVPR